VKGNNFVISALQNERFIFFFIKFGGLKRTYILGELADENVLNIFIIISAL